MYGLAGEQQLAEYKLDWLPGYKGSRAVRVGNAAAGVQLRQVHHAEEVRPGQRPAVVPPHPGPVRCHPHDPPAALRRVIALNQPPASGPALVTLDSKNQPGSEPSWDDRPDRRRVVGGGHIADEPTGDPAQQRPSVGVPGGRVRPSTLFRRGVFTSLGVLATAAAAVAVYTVRGVLILALIALFLAVSLDPAVRALSRWHIRRGLAILVVVLVAGRGLPAVGDPRDGRAVPGHGEGLPPLCRQHATPLGQRAPGQRPVPSDESDQRADQAQGGAADQAPPAARRPG